MRRLQWTMVGLSLVALAGCSDATPDSTAMAPGPQGAGDSADDDGSGDPGDGLGPAVGQGGAQDFGQFRAILEAGGIPGPQTLDDVGFWGEHRIPLGEADCGEDVCLSGRLAVMGNMMTGSNCTMVTMGLTTPVDLADLERLPLNLAIAIDTSGSMSGDPIAYVRDGLLRMQEALQPGDTVTLITFADDANVVAERVAAEDERLSTAIAELGAEGQTNVYAGLRTALQSVAASADSEHQNRVILLSDGQSTTGLVNDPRLLTLAEAYAGQGIGISTIGVGQEFNPSLMRSLAEIGGGAFYFLEDPAAVEEVFVEEVEAFLLPLAHDVVIEADIADGYELRGVFGTKLASTTAHRARIEIPSLQLAHRTSASDQVGGGRRGGGGAIAIELLPRPSVEDREVGTLNISYRTPYSPTRVEQTVEIDSPLQPGQTPPEGFFADDGARKAFVTLNLFVGFQMAAVRASAGDGGGALAVLEPLRDAVAEWTSTFDDADIVDDLRYVDLFIANLRQRGAVSPADDVDPPEPWPQD